MVVVTMLTVVTMTMVVVAMMVAMVVVTMLMVVVVTMVVVAMMVAMMVATMLMVACWAGNGGGVCLLSSVSRSPPQFLKVHQRITGRWFALDDYAKLAVRCA